LIPVVLFCGVELHIGGGVVGGGEAEVDARGCGYGASSARADFGCWRGPGADYVVERVGVIIDFGRFATSGFRLLLVLLLSDLIV